METWRTCNTWNNTCIKELRYTGINAQKPIETKRNKKKNSYLIKFDEVASEVVKIQKYYIYGEIYFNVQFFLKLNRCEYKLVSLII